MRDKLAQIRAIAFDFDGVFYDVKEIPNIGDILNKIKVDVACELCPDIFDHDTASKLAYRSYEEYGDAVTLLAAFVKQQGRDEQTFKEIYFALYHQKAYEYFTQNYPQIFCPQPDLYAAFMKCRGMVKHGIATNSCAENWASPHLKTFGVLEHFAPEAILGLPHSNFVPKGTHPMLFKMALDKMSANDAESLIAEDSSHNLELAKEHYPHLTTAFIHHGCPLSPKLPSHINYQFRDVAEMLRAIATAHLDKRFDMM